MTKGRPISPATPFSDLQHFLPPHFGPQSTIRCGLQHRSEPARQKKGRAIGFWLSHVLNISLAHFLTLQSFFGIVVSLQFPPFAFQPSPQPLFVSNSALGSAPEKSPIIRSCAPETLSPGSKLTEILYPSSSALPSLELAVTRLDTLLTTVETLSLRSAASRIAHRHQLL